MLKNLKNNLYFLLAYRLLLLIVLYSCCRYVFYTYNIYLFPNMDTGHLLTLMGAGLTFDVSAIMYINALYMTAQVLPLNIRYKPVYQKSLKVLFCVSNSLFLFFNCADIGYFRFTLRRTTLAVFNEFANDAANFNLIRDLIIDYWWVLLIWVIITFVLIFAYGTIRPRKPEIKQPKKYYTVGIAVMLACLALVIIGMRGNVKKLPPIDATHATLKVHKPIESNIVLNTPFTLIRTSSRKGLKPQNFFTDEEVAKIYSPIHTPSPTEAFRNKNVFIIILEGFGKANIGFYTQQTDTTCISYTPFLDSLAAQSYGFKYSFANGYGSINSIPAIIASIPSLVPGSYATSIYGNNRFVGIGELLAQKGYDCSFFHGATTGSMRFFEFSRQAGYQHYYGREDYNNESDYDGTWGIYDEPFLQYTANIVNAKPQPFLATVFTLSSHHPYNVPPKYKGMFREGPHPIQQAIGYADYSLRQFFNTVSKMPWYNNTLFVLVADHTGPTVYKNYLTATGTLEIPILFFDPSGELPKGQDNQKIMQQMDIVPSILGYLHYDKPYFAFGSSVFSAEHTNLSPSIQNGTYQFIDSEYVLQVSNGMPMALYNYVADPLLSTNLLSNNGTVPSRIDSLYKAFLQQYNDRLIGNNTIIEEK